MYSLNLFLLFATCLFLTTEALSNSWNKKDFNYDAIENYSLPQDEVILVSDAIMICNFSSSKKASEFWTLKLKFHFNETFLWSYKEGSNYRILFSGKRSSKEKPFIIRVSRAKNKAKPEPNYLTFVAKTNSIIDGLSKGLIKVKKKGSHWSLNCSISTNQEQIKQHYPAHSTSLNQIQGDTSIIRQYDTLSSLEKQQSRALKRLADWGVIKKYKFNFKELEQIKKPKYLAAVKQKKELSTSPDLEVESNKVTEVNSTANSAQQPENLETISEIEEIKSNIDTSEKKSSTKPVSKKEINSASLVGDESPKNVEKAISQARIEAEELYELTVKFVKEGDVENVMKWTNIYYAAPKLEATWTEVDLTAFTNFKETIFSIAKFRDFYSKEKERIKEEKLKKEKDVLFELESASKKLQASIIKRFGDEIALDMAKIVEEISTFKNSPEWKIDKDLSLALSLIDRAEVFIDAEEPNQETKLEVEPKQIRVQLEKIAEKYMAAEACKKKLFLDSEVFALIENQHSSKIEQLKKQHGDLADYEAVEEEMIKNGLKARLNMGIDKDTCDAMSLAVAFGGNLFAE